MTDEERKIWEKGLAVINEIRPILSKHRAALVGRILILVPDGDGQNDNPVASVEVMMMHGSREVYTHPEEEVQRDWRIFWERNKP